MSTALTLYSTDACSACDQALDLLLSTPRLAGRALNVVDVATSLELVERFGERVPVLAAEDASELYWPFDADSLERWLTSVSDAP